MESAAIWGQADLRSDSSSFVVSVTLIRSARDGWGVLYVHKKIS